MEESVSGFCVCGGGAYVCMYMPCFSHPLPHTHVQYIKLISMIENALYKSHRCDCHYNHFPIFYL